MYIHIYIYMFMCYLLRSEPLHHFEVPTATRKVERLPPVAILYMCLYIYIYIYIDR